MYFTYLNDFFFFTLFIILQVKIVSLLASSNNTGGYVE